jgi:hypothetical protein
MLRADNLSTFMCRLSWNLEESTSWNPKGLPRPYRDCFTFAYHVQVKEMCRGRYRCMSRCTRWRHVVECRYSFINSYPRHWVFRFTPRPPFPGTNWEGYWACPRAIAHVLEKSEVISLLEYGTHWSLYRPKCPETVTHMAVILFAVSEVI